MKKTGMEVDNNKEAEAAHQVSAPSDRAQVPLLWLSEVHTPNDVYNHGINEIIYAEHTKFQKLLIADVGAYGRALFLDGCLQTSEGDEAFYHEPIVHAPCILHGAVKKALILGGGDGGTARELLRWKTVESVTNVDIDGAVIEACRKHLPNLSKGAFDSPKCKIVVDDALSFLQNCDDKYDVIVCDLTDPIEQGPAAKLFNLEFFQLVRNHLTPEGTMSLQSGTISLSENATNLPWLTNTLSQVFPHVRVMQIYAPKYGGPLAITTATVQPVDLPTADQVDSMFLHNLHGDNRVLDGRAFHALFALPKCVSHALNCNVIKSISKVKSVSDSAIR